MKPIFRLWLISAAMGLCLLLPQPAQASNLQQLEWIKPFPAAISHSIEASLLASKAVSVPRVGVREISDSPSGQESFKFLDMDSVYPDTDSIYSDKFSDMDSVYSDTNSIYQLVMANPLNSGAWNNLGYQLFSLSHYVEALAAYNHALMIDPDYSLSLANRCAVLSQLGEYVQALDSCQRAITKDHRWGEQGPALAWDNQGDVLFNLQLYQEALKSFEQAIALNPNYVNAQRNWAIVQHELSEIAKEPNLENPPGDDDA